MTRRPRHRQRRGHEWLCFRSRVVHAEDVAPVVGCRRIIAEPVEQQHVVAPATISNRQGLVGEIGDGVEALAGDVGNGRRVVVEIPVDQLDRADRACVLVVILNLYW